MKIYDDFASIGTHKYKHKHMHVIYTRTRVGVITFNVLVCEIKLYTSD
jgi:hypothetical protein